MTKLNPLVLSLSHSLSSSSKTLLVPCSLLARNQTLLNKNQAKVNEFNISKSNLKGTFGVQERDVHFESFGQPKSMQPHFEALASMFETQTTFVLCCLVMLVVWVVILLVSLVLWFYKTKFLAFGTKSKKKWKVIAFH